MSATRWPLAGRDRELAELLAAFASSRADEARLALVSGEPGIGKTTLLDHFANRARAAGALVLRGACDDDASAQPYAPFIVALRALASADSGAAAVLARQWLDAVLAASPESAARARPRAHALAVDALVAACARQPVALLLDDLQWADEGSVALLRRVLRDARDVPLMLVVAYRDTDLEPTDPFEHALLALNRERVARRLALRRLDAASTRSIAERVAGAPAGSFAPAAVDALQRASEGVPFFIEELTLHLRERNSLRPGADGVWRLEPGAAAALPPSVRSVVGHRLNELRPETREALGVAAVVGGEWSLGILDAATRAAGLPSPALAHALDEALARRLVIERDRHEGDWSASPVYAFAHDQIRQVLYAGINPIRRRALHQWVGMALEEQAAGDARAIERVAARLAWHFSRGDDLRRAGRHALTGAAVASRAGAPDDAAQLYDLALDALAATNLPLRDDSSVALDRFEILLDRARTLADGPDRERAARASAAACAHADALGTARAVFESRLLAARLATTRGAGHDAEACAARALDAAQELDDRARFDALLALAAAHLGRPAGEPAPLLRARPELLAARQWLLAARAIAEHMGAPHDLARAHQELGVTEWALADPDDAQGATTARLMLIEALDGFRACADRRGEITALIALAYRRSVAPGTALVPLDDTYVSFLEEIRRLRSTERALARGSGRARLDALTLLSTHTYCRANGWLETALARGRDALDLATSMRDRRIALLARLGLSETCRLLGRPREALEVAEVALSAIQSDADAAGRLAAHRDAARRELAAARAQAGNTAAALPVARERVAQAERAGRPTLIADAAVELAELLVGANIEPTEAERAARLALDAARGLRGSITWDVRAELALARLALRSGAVDIAAGHAVAAGALLEARDVPAIWLQAAAPLVRALTREAAGALDDARAELARGAAVIQRVAARIEDAKLRASFLAGNPLAAETSAVARRLGMAGAVEGARVQPRAFGNLTPREIEVLRLVAVGKTNRDIAGQLYISEKTVARHLTNIFTKIDAESRTQAAAWAFRNGLA